MTEFTLKRIGFKAGRSEQSGAVAEVVFVCDEPDQVLDLVPHISHKLTISFMALQPELPLEERQNGTAEEDAVVFSAGRRRRGTRADPTQDE